MNIERIAMDCLGVNEETLQKSSMELKKSMLGITATQCATVWP